MFCQEYEQVYRDSLGAHVVERRNEEYIRQMTAEHVDLLDPTGRLARVFPSQVSNIPDHSIGLGHSSRIDASRMRGITDRIRTKLKLEETDFGEYQRLVSAALPLEERRLAASAEGAIPRQTEDLVAGDDASLFLMSTVGEMVPGRSQTVIDINLGSSVAEVIPEESLSISSRKLGGVYTLPVLSKFETDCFETKKTKTRERLEEGSPQIAAGRQFKGPGFASKPEVLLFKDFEVGEKYIKRFTLTNISNTFNSFKLAPFDSSLENFLSVSYERQGRMSAGVSCVVELTFTPQINEDIDTVLHFLSETGPGAIPIRVRMLYSRKCKPLLILLLSFSVLRGSVLLA